jgi:hypothetical protein
MRNIRCGNAPSIVLHHEYGLLRVLGRRDSQRPRTAGVEIGHRVGQEIAEDLRQGEGIGLDYRQGAHGHLHLACRELVGQRAQRVLDQASRVHRCQVEFLSAKTGELEDCLDETIHLRHRRLNKAQGFRAGEGLLRMSLIRYLL